MLLSAGITDINVALSLWTAITFAILLFVLGKFAWGPILQMMETREKTIADAIEAAKVHRQENDYSSVIGMPIDTSNEPDLQYTPLCPQGGVY